VSLNALYSCADRKGHFRYSILPDKRRDIRYLEGWVG
jgi:hypothetical protein